LARALKGEFADDTVVEVRARGSEEAIGNFRLRTLQLDVDTADGTLYAVIQEDITEASQAEERFERTFAANPAPALICKLSDFRVVKVNAGFLQMTDLTRDALLGHSISSLDLFDGDEGRKMTLARLADHQTIAQTESTVRMASGDLKSVIMAGQPIDMGDEPCMLLTFVDIDAKRKVENALRVSEELFSKAFRLAPVPMMVVTHGETRILDANDAFYETCGRLEDAVLGHTVRELELWRQTGQLRVFEQELARSGSVRNLEASIRGKDDETLDCSVSAEIVMINQQNCSLIVLQDITERKRTETELIVAIEAVMQDTSWFSRSVIEKLAAIRHPGGARMTGPALGDLTSREQDVLGALCQGLTDAEIASRLAIARNTVRNHISTIYGKIGVNRRGAAIVWARERGFTGAKSRNVRK
jgi:PAS domain S-box-containing protein